MVDSERQRVTDASSNESKTSHLANHKNISNLSRKNSELDGRCLGFAYDYGRYPKIVAVHSNAHNEMPRDCLPSAQFPRDMHFSQIRDAAPGASSRAPLNKYHHAQTYVDGYNQQHFLRYPFPHVVNVVNPEMNPNPFGVDIDNIPKIQKEACGIPIEAVNFQRNEDGIPPEAMRAPRENNNVLTREAKGLPREANGISIGVIGMPRETNEMPREADEAPREANEIPTEVNGMLTRASGMSMEAIDDARHHENSMPPETIRVQMEINSMPRVPYEMPSNHNMIPSNAVDFGWCFNEMPPEVRGCQLGMDELPRVTHELPYEMSDTSNEFYGMPAGTSRASIEAFKVLREAIRSRTKDDEISKRGVNGIPMRFGGFSHPMDNLQNYNRNVMNSTRYQNLQCFQILPPLPPNPDLHHRQHALLRSRLEKKRVEVARNKKGYWVTPFNAGYHNQQQLHFSPNGSPQAIAVAPVRPFDTTNPMESPSTKRKRLTEEPPVISTDAYTNSGGQIMNLPFLSNYSANHFADRNMPWPHQPVSTSCGQPCCADRNTPLPQYPVSISCSQSHFADQSMQSHQPVSVSCGQPCFSDQQMERPHQPVTSSSGQLSLQENGRVSEAFLQNNPMFFGKQFNPEDGFSESATQVGNQNRNGFPYYEKQDATLTYGSDHQLRNSQLENSPFEIKNNKILDKDRKTLGDHLKQENEKYSIELPSEIFKIVASKDHKCDISQLLLLENKLDLLETLKRAADTNRASLLFIVERLLSHKLIENALILLDNLKRSDFTEKTKEKILSIIQEKVWGYAPRLDLWVKPSSPPTKVEIFDSPQPCIDNNPEENKNIGSGANADVFANLSKSGVHESISAENCQNEQESDGISETEKSSSEVNRERAKSDSAEVCDDANVVVKREATSPLTCFASLDCSNNENDSDPAKATENTRCDLTFEKESDIEVNAVKESYTEFVEFCEVSLPETCDESVQVENSNDSSRTQMKNNSEANDDSFAGKENLCAEEGKQILSLSDKEWTGVRIIAESIEELVSEIGPMKEEELELLGKVMVRLDSSGKLVIKKEMSENEDDSHVVKEKFNEDENECLESKTEWWKVKVKEEVV